MSTWRSTLRRLQRPGIAVVSTIAAVAMVACVIVVLTIGRSHDSPRAPGDLRSYSAPPQPMWTMSPAETAGVDPAQWSPAPQVVGVHGDRWLLTSRGGDGIRVTEVRAETGTPIWSGGLDVGLGMCAFDDAGHLGCVRRPLTATTASFGLVDDSGRFHRSADVDDTAGMVGVTDGFALMSKVGHRVTGVGTDGSTTFSTTLTSPATLRWSDATLTAARTDGGASILDPATGEQRYSCTSCTLTTYPSGVAAEIDSPDGDASSSVTLIDTAGRITATETDTALVAGPSPLPVLTGAGPTTVFADHGTYEARDLTPGSARRWRSDSTDNSKSGAQACGSMFFLPKIDRSRQILDFGSGDTVGTLAPASVNRPDTDLDQLTCLGSHGNTAIFTDTDTITAVDVARGRVSWQLPFNGTVEVVDGYLVLRQGTELSVLQPN